MKRKLFPIILFFFWFVFCFSFSFSSAYVMSSGNFRVESDSINVGGEDISSSTNFNLKDTIGEVGTGNSSSDNYYVNAGYRQMDEIYLAITGPGNINLAPTIGGLGGGAASGSGVWNVKTDSPAGYSLYVKANTSPAMVSGANDFADYSPGITGVPDYNWDIGEINSEFGFSPYNPWSQVDKFKNNGSDDCNAGSIVADEKCWLGLSSEDEQIVNKTARTSNEGEDTKINFQAEIKSGGFQMAGNYSATIVVTAVSN